MSLITQHIATVLGIRQSQACDIAQRIGVLSGDTTQISDPADALRRMTKASLVTAGLTPRRAEKLIAALQIGKAAYVTPPSPRKTIVDKPSLAAELLLPVLGYADKEKAAVIVLDIKHRWLAVDVIAIGAKDPCVFHPREVFKAALHHDGSRVILAHNHPSGDLEPSPEDQSLTEQMIQAGEGLGIPVLDPLIIGNGNFMSLRETTDLWAAWRP